MSTKLLNCLVEENAAIASFIELLDEEQQTLGSGQFDTFPAVTERKAQLVERIEMLDRAREAEQMALGFPANYAGAEAAAARDEKTHKVWRELLERASQAHQCNHRNGVMVHAHLDYTRQSINFLHASGQSLYGPNGTHKAPAGSGNHLAVG